MSSFCIIIYTPLYRFSGMSTFQTFYLPLHTIFLVSHWNNRLLNLVIQLFKYWIAPKSDLKNLVY